MSAITALGFDFGQTRIGVAIGQSISRTASPLATLTARAGQPDWTEIQRLISEWRPDLLIVGRPTTADGAPHPLAPAIERFAGRLQGRFGLPIEYVDERLSSHEALSARRSRRATLDAVAARLILETWLNSPRAATSSAA